MSSVIGARVVFGLAVAGVAASGFMFWRLSEAKDEAADLRAAVQSTREVAESNAREATEAQARAERLDSLLAKQRERERKRRAKLRDDIGSLRDALSGDDCAGRAVPDDARRRLFGDAGDRNESADDSGSGPDKSD